jgi:hypothetical protein
MKKLILSMKQGLLLLAGLLTVLAVVPQASAMPSFARQTGKACNTCHFQHYPTLNAYGQDFKAGGYTDMGKQGTIKGKGLSLPEVLNLSVFTKVRYLKDNGTDIVGQPTRASGEWNVPDELALLSGGRIADNVGYLLEMQLANAAAATVAGFKMPFMFKAGGSKLGIIPYTTDTLGAAYGFELLATGAVRNNKVMESRVESSAQQYILTDGPAMGVALVAANPLFFANFSKWSPNHGASANGNVSRSPTSNYLRAAFTPTVGDWDLAVGFQSWSGTSNQGGAIATTAVQTKAFSIDAQAQGAIGNMPLGVYFASSSAPGTPVGLPAGTAANLFNANPNTSRATTLTGELGVIPNKLTLMLSQRNANSGAALNSTDNATTFGIRYAYSQNLGFQLEHSTRSKAGAVGRYTGSLTPGDARTILMLSAGF